MTEIYKITGREESDTVALKKAAGIIRDGGLVVFPTETVYGLGADGTSSEAAKKIYAAKGRPSDNPLIIHVYRPEDAEKYAYTGNTFYNLAKAFMPGPLTVVLKARESVPKETRGGLDTVAVRCPSHPVAQKLIELSETCIAAPSANISGKPSPTSAAHVIDDMTGRVDFIIDAGDSDFGLESTIVKIDEENSLTLLRPGKITVDDLLSVVNEVKIASAVTEGLKEGEKAVSPGMKYRHYAPKAPLTLYSGTPEKIAQVLINSKEKIALIAYGDEIEAYRSLLPGISVYSFGSKYDREEQAHRLFSLLRQLDKSDCEKIYAPMPDTEGIGLALYNRMIRAAAFNTLTIN